MRGLLGSETPRTVFNFKSASFKKSGLAETELSDAQLADLLVEEPRYFKRPMAVIDGRLIAGTNAKRLGDELGFELYVR